MFTGKVAIITGAAQGIGKAIAQQLLLDGAQVVINDIDEEKAIASAIELDACSAGRCLAFPGDASQADFIDTLIEFTLQHFGQVDIGVANAGITLFGDFFNFSPKHFKKVMDLNLQGTFFLVQRIARQMRTQGQGGKLLLMSSNIGQQAYPRLAAYSMTKAAINMLAKSLVPELSPFGIHINAIAPGATLTDRAQSEFPTYGAAWGAITPLKKPATPAEIAQAALFLLSNAASHITGQILTVDGGWSVTSPYPNGTLE